MRKEILASWERCRQSGLSRVSGNDRPVVLDSQELSRMRERHSLFLDVALPVMNDLHALIKGTGFLTMLTDQEGNVLEVLVDEQMDRFASDVHLVAGSVWREDIVGTNAISLSVLDGKPSQVIGSEHYWKKFDGITCSAAPIYDEQNELIGVINVSGPVEKVHSHTAGMVVSCARAIERQLKLLQITKEMQQANETMNALLDVIEDGVIVIDEKLRIRQTNFKAASILKRDQSELLHREITEFFSSPHFKESILAYSPVQDEIMTVSSLGITCVVQITPIVRPGEHFAAVVTFREIQQIRRLARRIDGNKAYITLKELRGSSKPMKDLQKQALRVARSDATVLLFGESGSGKELVAQSIHNASLRKDGQFIVINCAALPRTLIESELFGYEAGTFTGGLKQGRPGKFELANGGTIFLDEIGDMPLDMQVMLLRVLQEKSVTRLGGRKPIPVDVRVIAATNKDLQKAIDEKEFREDLYYRLNVLNIQIPPLRSRISDIPELIDWFIGKYTPEKEKKKKFSSDALRLMQRYDWPGNVRELENVVQRCLIMAENETIEKDDLPLNMQKKRNVKPLADQSYPVFKDLKHRALFRALNESEGDVETAAKLLGISRATAYRWLKKYRE